MSSSSGACTTTRGRTVVPDFPNPLDPLERLDSPLVPGALPIRKRSNNAS